MHNPNSTLVDLETKFWQLMLDHETDVALNLLCAPALMVSTHGAMKFDHTGYPIIRNGGQESECGWCKDRWGVSWQITPRVLIEALSDADPAAARRAFDAMMTMRKIDIATIEAARHADASVSV